MLYLLYRLYGRTVVITLPLFVDLDCFLKILHHIFCRRRGLHHVTGRIHDALCKVRGIERYPLRLLKF